MPVPNFVWPQIDIFIKREIKTGSYCFLLTCTGVGCTALVWAPGKLRSLWMCSMLGTKWARSWRRTELCGDGALWRPASPISFFFFFKFNGSSSFYLPYRHTVVFHIHSPRPPLTKRESWDCAPVPLHLRRHCLQRFNNSFVRNYMLSKAHPHVRRWGNTVPTLRDFWYYARPPM